MPRVSLPRQAPRVYVPRRMPGPFVHSYAPYYSGAYAYQSDGIRLSNVSYTDAIHNNYFVQKSWAIEFMWYPGEGYNGYVKVISDQKYRLTQFGSRIGTVIQVDKNGSIQIYFTDPGGGQLWGVSGGLGVIPDARVWTHIAMSYTYNAADPAASRFKVYVDGYKTIDSTTYLTALNMPYLGNLRALYATTNLDVLGCVGGGHRFKYFRMLDYDPWPEGGFEIPNPYKAFTGTGTWKPGVNIPDAYPSIDPAREIVKFDFSNKLTVNDIVDESPNHYTVEYASMLGSQLFFVP